MPRVKAFTEAEKASWVRWLASYGADKFLDHFMRNGQGVESICQHCGEKIYQDVLIGGGVVDWGSGSDGQDFGCLSSPDTSSDGTGGHMPRMMST